MTRITWDQPGQLFYEAGVSRGIFYGSDASGIPWNGLISVDQSNNDSVDPLYFDGFKFGDVVTLGDFEGRITAFTYPDEFLLYEGLWDVKDGVSLGNQPKERFGLCYRTEIGNDISQNAAYKIHILYNLLAIPAEKSYQTMSLDTEPTEFEWDVTGIPEDVDNFRPTAYVVLDSRKIDPYLMMDLEDVLYGSETREPTLPNLKSLVSFVQKWGRLVITDNGDGTWTASSPIEGVIEMLDEETFQITADTAVYLDAVTYEISSDEELEVDP